MFLRIKNCSQHMGKCSVPKLQTPMLQRRNPEISKALISFSKTNWKEKGQKGKGPWKQCSEQRKFIISNWFNMFCYKHTPGNIFLKSSVISRHQAEPNRRVVLGWDDEIQDVFLALLTHPHPHTPFLNPVSPCWRSQKVSHPAAM